MDIDYYTIEPSRCGEFYDVYGHGRYERSSVLAGQLGRSFQDSFATLEEAKAAYPQAEETGSSKFMYSQLSMPSSPPSGFDPADAGERWNPDDP